MTGKDYHTIALSIWRSGYIERKNKIVQQAREDMRRLIAIDIAASFQDDPNFDKELFMKTCGL